MTEEAAGDSRELEHYSAVLQRRWRLLLLVAGVTVASACVYIALAPRVYEATATLMVVRSATDDMPSDPGSTATARALFDSPTMAASVLQEVQPERGGVRLAPSTFLRDVLRVDEVRGTSLLRVSARLRDPELAARIANRVAESTVERSGQLARNAESGEQKVLKAQLDAADVSLQAAQQRLLAYRTESQLDLLRQERSVLLAQRAEVPRLLVDIAAEQARLAKAEEELEKLGQSESRHSGTLTFPKRVPLDVAPRSRDAARPAAGGDTPAALAERPSGHDASGELETGLALREALQYQVTVSRSRLAGLEAERRLLMDRMKPDGPGLQQLSDLHQHEIAIVRLEVEHDVLKTVYADIARRYQQARLEAVAQATELQILEPAVAPARPVFPQPARILTIALFGGLIVSLVVIFTIEAVQQDRRVSIAGPAGSHHRAGLHEGISRPADTRALLNVDRRNGV